MHDKHIAITGPTAGIGRSTALELARRGARLTLLCRNPGKGAGLQAEIVAAGGQEKVDGGWFELIEPEGQYVVDPILGQRSVHLGRKLRRRITQNRQSYHSRLNWLVAKDFACDSPGDHSHRRRFPESSPYPWY